MHYNSENARYPLDPFNKIDNEEQKMYLKTPFNFIVILNIKVKIIKRYKA